LIDSTYNIIWKVVQGMIQKIFCLDCKFGDGLNSSKSCPFVGEVYIKTLFINLYVTIKSPCNFYNTKNADQVVVVLTHNIDLRALELV